MKLHGIKVPHKKNTADSKPVRMTVPKTVTIPMSMHIGKPSKPIVKKGDIVKVGQLIGEPDGFVSSAIHSSVSGKVAKIDEMTSSMGMKIQCITIESDGEQTLYEEIKAPKVNDFESLKTAVKESGVVGLGGAGFPTFVKLSVKDLEKVEAVVINAAECEPYITSDTRTMLDNSEYIVKGIDALERDRKGSSQATQEVEIYFSFVGKYLEDGIPLVEKCITVDGSAIKDPKNMIAPIGTSIADLIEAAGGYKCEPRKILYGGPMMGIAVPSDAEPVLKNTNAIIAMDEKEATPKKTTACIGCGACMNHCPFRLDPREIARAYKLDRGEELEKLCVDLCMECGCCSFVCPANRPLVQTNKLAKIKLRAYQTKKKAEAEKEGK